MLEKLYLCNRFVTKTGIFLYLYAFFMIVTVEWMEKWFRFFDDEYFGGKLPTPELGVTRAKTRLGQMAYKRATRWGRTKLYDFKISMSTYYAKTPRSTVTAWSTALPGGADPKISSRSWLRNLRTISS